MSARLPSISVVIPTLNEAAHIRETIRSIRRQEEPFEIIVADGGSCDNTVEIAGRYARVSDGRRGRARQMNAGAALAQGEILLFLHADTVLPWDAFAAIRRQLAGAGVEAGTFRLRFDRATPLLRLYGLGTRIRSPLLCFGDRGLFVHRDVFRAVGGFPSIPLFEDLELARLLHQRRRFVFLDLAVTTSSRRFHHNGPFLQQLRNAYLWASYLAGTDPHRLTHLYPYSKTRS